MAWITEIRRLALIFYPKPTMTCSQEIPKQKHDMHLMKRYPGMLIKDVNASEGIWGFGTCLTPYTCVLSNGKERDFVTTQTPDNRWNEQLSSSKSSSMPSSYLLLHEFNYTTKRKSWMDYVPKNAEDILNIKFWNLCLTQGKNTREFLTIAHRYSLVEKCYLKTLGYPDIKYDGLLLSKMFKVTN